MRNLALRYFVEVAEVGSFSAASQRLHVAISAVSRQIAHLEDDVGAPLFTRLPRGVALTRAGELLLAHARRVALDAQSVLTEIASLDDPVNQVIRVANSEGIAQHVMPILMAEFRRRHPQVSFILHVLTPAESVHRLIDGRIDVAVNYTVEPSRGVEVRQTWRVPVMAVMSSDHPLAVRPQVSVAEILAYPLAMTDGFSTARSLLERYLALNSIQAKLQIALESNYSQALFKFVANSDAITLAGDLSVYWRLEPENLILRPMDSKDFLARSLQIQVMAGRAMPPLADAFIEFVQREITRVQESSV